LLPRLPRHHLPFGNHAVVAGQAHHDSAQLVLIGAVSSCFGWQRFNIAVAKGQVLGEQRSNILSKKGIAAGEWVVECARAGSCVAAAACRAAVRSMAARATTPAVVVGAEDVIAFQPIQAITSVGLRRYESCRDQNHQDY
jgi:hypothetical protein